MTKQVSIKPSVMAEVFSVDYLPIEYRPTEAHIRCRQVGKPDKAIIHLFLPLSFPRQGLRIGEKIKITVERIDNEPKT